MSPEEARRIAAPHSSTIAAHYGKPYVELTDQQVVSWVRMNAGVVGTQRPDRTITNIDRGNSLKL